MQLRRVFLPILGLLMAIATEVMAQTPVPALQDLVGVRGSSGETEMQNRGYHFVATDKSESGVYMYWREKQTKKCVTVRVEDGRYQSIVYAPDSDCHSARTASAASSHPEVGTPVGALQDLVGANAGQAENTVQTRGYKFLKSSPSGDRIYGYWREVKTGYCVVIQTADGRYQSIVYGTQACN